MLEGMKIETINLLIQDKSVIGTVFGSVFGTIVGTLLGFILNQWTRTGKLKIYIYDFKERCFINARQSNQEDRETSYVKDSTNRLDCRFSVDIYNGSLDVRVMRELKLVFQSKVKDDYIITAYDIDRTSFDGVGVKYREVKPVNIQPKGIITLRLFNDVNINDYDFTDIKRIYIQYRNEKNKVKRIIVKKFVK